jgi:hypothetical protein
VDDSRLWAARVDGVSSEDAKRLGGSPVEYAKAVGTYGKIDRSAQYEGEFDGLDGTLLRRKLQSKYDEVWAEIRRRDDRKFYHHLMIMAASAILARGPEIYSFLLKLFR